MSQCCNAEVIANTLDRHLKPPCRGKASGSMARAGQHGWEYSVLTTGEGLIPAEPILPYNTAIPVNLHIRSVLSRLSPSQILQTLTKFLLAYLNSGKCFNGADRIL